MPEACVNIGDFRCYPVADGDFLYPKGALFANRSDEELAPVLGPDELSTDLRVGYSSLLIDTGRRRILIDTGAGPLGPSTGRLLERLNRCGFGPHEIDVVVLSHLHADHIGGLLTSDGELSFPNAEFLVSRLEHDFWMSETNQTKLKSGELFGLGELEQVLLSWVQKYIPPLTAEGKLRLIEPDCELAPGVLVVPAFGHTPGHLAVLAASRNQQLIFGGDALLHPAHVQYPEWTAVVDALPEAAVRTRRQLLDRAVTDGGLMFLFHFPFPCLGSVSRRNGGYRWDPIEL
jgi:glyoxylase-like metal-dependent hydrolase (beta-lactamase superfamily II)